MRLHILLLITVSMIALGCTGFIFSGYTHFDTALASTYPLYEKSTKRELRQAEEALLSAEADTQPTVTHIQTPTPVRALYMTSWVAGTKKLRQPIIDLIDTTPLNAVIIDIKDDTGKISFLMDDPLLELYGSMENRISDIDALIKELHDKNIYVIGRISSFQDDYLAPTLPHLAVQNTDGSVWTDRKGLSWFDAGAPEVWEYIITIAENAYAIGFDEINVDYVRFPTDGSKKMVFPVTGEGIKSEAIRSFFKTLDERLRFQSGIPLSADVFGMVTTNTDDMGIGQLFEYIAPYVDYIAPMIYPSHYPATFHGYANPAEHPYEIITIANKGAIDKLTALGEPITKLRPWLQDFNMGATYTADKVYAQIQAGKDQGINGFMMWDASNTYTQSAYTRITE